MYERVIQKALQTPWAIEPRYLAIIQSLLVQRHSGQRLTAEEIRERIGVDAARPDARGAGGGAIAVIPVFGVIAHRAFEASSGATSTEWIGRLVRQALANEEVGTLLFDISSPGGTVEGVPELATLIFEARQVKHVAATSNGLACSAAYWLGSQASEFICTPSGYVGSVGVYALFEDWSEYLAKEGIKINAISAGDYKLEGAPWEPLSDEARAFIQADVDRVYVDFLKAVSRGRETGVDDVKANFGKGRAFDAKTAKKLGMIDRIETFDATIARLSKSGRRATTGARAEDVASDVCAACKGSGLKPEAYMGDPTGQEPCEACAGSGKKTATESSDQAAADLALLQFAEADADLAR